MKGFQRIVSNTVFALLCLLIVLLLFEPHIQIPYWLQPLGRMHPLLLHFPVALVFLLVFISFLKPQIDATSYRKINGFLLQLTALTTALTAVMGFVLFKEGYASELMTWHKWLGVALAFLAYVLIFIETKKRLYYPILYSSGIIMIMVGHFGAGITHGANFLTEPLLTENTPVIDENTPIFQGFVQPILDKKCVSCHNPDKHKGELIMSSATAILKGGENGPIWLAGNSGESAIIKRALLPIEHEDHMPPEGKPQLAEEEIALIKHWIDAGADTLATFASLSDTIPLHSVISEEWLSKQNNKPQYGFEHADATLIASLNNPYRTVLQKSPKSPAIEVAVFGQSAFHPESISELLGIREQVVTLNLSHLPVTDDLLEPVAKMVNLEELNLNFTDVTSQGLAKLATCTELESIALSGTQVNAQLKNTLEGFPKLKTVYLWETNISKPEFEALQSTFPNIHFVAGHEEKLDETFQLGAPILRNKSSVLAKGDLITLDHKLKDVSIRFTRDGSEPDSTSQLYSTPLRFDSGFELKTKAFKLGWEASDESIFSFFKKGKKPISLELISMPDHRNKGLGGLTLVDDYIGGQERMISLAWLGFTETPLIALADFGASPPPISEVLLSYCLMEWRRIAPPKSVEIWGGDEKDQLKLIKKATVDFKKEFASHGVSNMSVTFPQHSLRYYKIVAERFEKLPNWHQKKGEEGFLFVDELFFYE